MPVNLSLPEAKENLSKGLCVFFLMSDLHVSKGGTSSCVVTQPTSPILICLPFVLLKSRLKLFQFSMSPNPFTEDLWKVKACRICHLAWAIYILRNISLFLTVMPLRYGLRVLLRCSVLFTSSQISGDLGAIRLHGREIRLIQAVPSRSSQRFWNHPCRIHKFPCWHAFDCKLHFFSWMQ